MCRCTFHHRIRSGNSFGQCGWMVSHCIVNQWLYDFCGWGLIVIWLGLLGLRLLNDQLVWIMWIVKVYLLEVLVVYQKSLVEFQKSLVECLHLWTLFSCGMFRRSLVTNVGFCSWNFGSWSSCKCPGGFFRWLYTWVDVGVWMQHKILKFTIITLVRAVG